MNCARVKLKTITCHAVDTNLLQLVGAIVRIKMREQKTSRTAGCAQWVSERSERDVHLLSNIKTNKETIHIVRIKFHILFLRFWSWPATSNFSFYASAWPKLSNSTNQIKLSLPGCMRRAFLNSWIFSWFKVKMASFLFKNIILVVVGFMCELQNVFAGTRFQPSIIWDGFNPL